MTIAPKEQEMQEARAFATKRRYRDLDPEEKFAITPILDDVIDAAASASKEFASSFPGWQLHSRIYRGERMFDRQLAAWAVGLARALSRARKTNGRTVVAPRTRRNDWIMAAGLDAMTFTINGRFPATAEERGAQFGITDDTFAALRNMLAACMVDGWENFDNAMKLELVNVERINRRIFLRQ